MFFSRAPPSLALKSLSVAFFKALLVGHVDMRSNAAAAAQYGVTRDALLLFPAGSAEPTVYGGKLAFAELSQFLAAATRATGPREKGEL